MFSLNSGGMFWLCIENTLSYHYTFIKCEFIYDLTEWILDTSFCPCDKVMAVVIKSVVVVLSRL